MIVDEFITVSITNTIVIGGFSKLLKYIIVLYKNLNVNINKNYSNGDLFMKYGFSYVSDGLPNCYYINGSKRTNNGIDRIYDSGFLILNI